MDLSIAWVLAVIDVDEIGQVESLATAMTNTDALIFATVKDDDSGIVVYSLAPSLFRYECRVRGRVWNCTF